MKSEFLRRIEIKKAPVNQGRTVLTPAEKNRKPLTPAEKKRKPLTHADKFYDEER